MELAAGANVWNRGMVGELAISPVNVNPPHFYPDVNVVFFKLGAVRIPAADPGLLALDHIQADSSLLEQKVKEFI